MVVGDQSHVITQDEVKLIEDKLAEVIKQDKTCQRFQALDSNCR